MRKTWAYGSVLAAVCFVWAGSLLAQDAAAEKKTAPKKDVPPAERLFKKLDKNADGGICIREFKGNRKRAQPVKAAQGG